MDYKIDYELLKTQNIYVKFSDYKRATKSRVCESDGSTYTMYIFSATREIYFIYSAFDIYATTMVLVPRDGMIWAYPVYD